MTVDVTVTSAAWNPSTGAVEVSSFVPVVETDGQCTLTMRSDAGTTATVLGQAYADASSTSCGLLSSEGRQLTTGHWQVTVSYESPRTHGTSAPSDVEVP